MVRGPWLCHGHFPFAASLPPYIQIPSYVTWIAAYTALNVSPLMLYRNWRLTFRGTAELIDWLTDSFIHRNSVNHNVAFFSIFITFCHKFNALLQRMWPLAMFHDHLGYFSSAGHLNACWFLSFFRPPEHEFRRAFVLPQMFFFVTRSPRSHDQSPWNFATWSKSGWIL